MTCPICSSPRRVRKDGTLGKTCGSKVCGGKLAASKMPAGHYRRIGGMAKEALRARGKRLLVRPHEMRLMAQGRFYEAARSVYDRGYSAGWVGRKNGRRQLPTRVA